LGDFKDVPVNVKA
jgi:hypothetical protein